MVTNSIKQNKADWEINAVLILELICLKNKHIQTFVVKFLFVLMTPQQNT